jgi:ferredoxin-NADP reductase
MGEFQLPAVLPSKILLLSVGSGITPLMAMLRDWQQRGPVGDLPFVHVCRSAEDLIFAQTLPALAARHPTLKLHLHFSATMGRFDSATLRRLVSDLATRATWLCGPAALMDTVHGLWRREAFAAPLRSERFAAAPLQPAVTLGMPVAVVCAASGKRFSTHGAAPLLEQAERAGLAPRHGCRIGICRSCQCVKHSGTVQNLQTGELSSTPNELIRLCISAARSDLALEL